MADILVGFSPFLYNTANSLLPFWVVVIALIILPGVFPFVKIVWVDSHKSQGLEVVRPVLFYSLLSLWRNSASQHLFRANREVMT